MVTPPFRQRISIGSQLTEADRHALRGRIRVKKVDTKLNPTPRRKTRKLEEHPRKRQKPGLRREHGEHPTHRNPPSSTHEAPFSQAPHTPQGFCVQAPCTPLHNGGGTPFAAGVSSPAPMFEASSQAVVPSSSAGGLGLADKATLEIPPGFADDGGFQQLTDWLFVVNGWNQKKQMPTVCWFAWIVYHDHLIKINDSSSLAGITFTASRARASQSAPVRNGRHPKINVFILYFLKYMEMRNFRKEKRCPTRNLNVFSVPARSLPTVHNRAIVQFEGLDSGQGIWTCSKDPSASNCYHIGLASKFMQDHFGSERIEDSGQQALRYDASRIRAPRRTIPISHQRRPPPLWACTSEEETANAARFGIPSIRSITADEPIALQESDACVCSREKATYSPFVGTVKQACTVYGFSRAWAGAVLLQKCPICKSRMIGPDGRSLRLFNWNNHVIVAEELLDDYTNAFLGSETPFKAFTTLVSRRYKSSCSPIPFLQEKTFLEAWFGYIELVDIDLRNNTMCTKCGPTPATTIWDGVTLAFNQRYVKTSLEPPTIITDTSPTRFWVKYLKDQQCIPKKELRRLLRKVLVGPSLIQGLIAGPNTLDPSDTFAEVSSDDDSNTKAKKDLEDRFATIPNVHVQLRALDLSLGDLFDRWFGPAAIGARREPPAPYQRFFFQISAEESVLQMVNRPALADLAAFMSSPSRATLDALITIPVIYDILCYEHDIAGSINSDTRGSLEWIYSRAQVVLNMLVKQNGKKMMDDGVVGVGIGQNTPEPAIIEKNWKLTGCRYSMPQVQHRPQYPNLKYDNAKDSAGSRNKKRADCSKYYSQYSEQRLTGGIMCAWCPHSICYGFHCIPKGEGRNDVFSAIITRWKEPPKRVVYDSRVLLPHTALPENRNSFLTQNSGSIRSTLKTTQSARQQHSCQHTLRSIPNLAQSILVLVNAAIAD
ncbi:hypothetical protein NMY22_g2495 [Coprinellus aureogranulatus]|nr:hypothetical protein NMY22_g2495 [Coprinellus aureogranulatus]